MNASENLDVYGDYWDASIIVCPSYVTTIHQPATNRKNVSYTTDNGHNIMWLQKTHDSCGNNIGPFYTKSDVRKTVNYLKSYHNPHDGKQALDKDVNDYIDHFISDFPNVSEYKPFVRYY